MVGSSGVDRRKGTEADDCGYGWRSSLYSNGGRQRDGRVVPDSCLGKRVLLMWAAEGWTDGTCVV